MAKQETVIGIPSVRKTVPPTPYTPGPWEARGYKTKEGHIWVDCNSWANPKTASCRGGTVATVMATGVGDDATAEANARLIAAAPELLDALKRLWGSSRSEPVGKDGKDCWLMSQEALDNARAIIAKAEGG